MRSTCPSGTASSDGAPTLAEETRKPSIRRSVWPRFAPRMNTPDVEPGPPFCTISMPAWRCSNSARLWAPLRAISSASMTVTSAISCSIGCDMRVAVTKIDPIRAAPGLCAAAVADAKTAIVADGRKMRRAAPGPSNERNIARSAKAVRPRTAWRKMRSGKSAQRSPTEGLQPSSDGATTTLPASRPWIRRSTTAECGGAPGAGRSPGSSHGPSAFPSRACAAVASWTVLLKDLPLRGQLRNECVGTTHRTEFPFHPPRWNAADTCKRSIRRKETAKSEPLLFAGLVFRRIAGQARRSGVLTAAKKRARCERLLEYVTQLRNRLAANGHVEQRAAAGLDREVAGRAKAVVARRLQRHFGA